MTRIYMKGGDKVVEGRRMTIREFPHGSLPIAKDGVLYLREKNLLVFFPLAEVYYVEYEEPAK